MGPQAEIRPRQGKAVPAVVHVDLDGAVDIYKAHKWRYPYTGDPLFETGLTNILALLEGNGIRATFFVIADSMDDPRKRAMVKMVVAHGHEVASHSLTHAFVRHLDPDRKRREIAESREKLQQLLGVEVSGFRAPGYQIDRTCVELLAECGYTYDASAFPTVEFSRRLGVPIERLQAPGRPFEGLGLMELILPDHSPSPFPFSPSYALLFGFAYFRWGLRRFRQKGTPLVLLFHLTDVADPLPAERMHGLGSRVFTLSLLSRRYKVARCQRMLDLVQQHYRFTTTAALVDELAGSPVA